MISIVSLLYDLDLKLNKVATGKHESIPLEDKIIAINEAQNQLVKQKIDPNNVYKLGFEAFKKRYDDLENFVVPDVALVLAQDKTSKLHKYVTSLVTIKDFMFYIDCYFLCDKGPCKDHIVVGNRVKHGDLQTVLNNSNTNPSFEYQETPVTVSDEKLEMYTDGSFTPTSAHVSYLRYPKQVDMEGYIHFDGSNSIDSNSEFKAFLKDELVDLAVQELALATENQGAIQASQQRIQNNE
jgi:hypothetical protein